MNPKYEFSGGPVDGQALGLNGHRQPYWAVFETFSPSDVRTTRRTYRWTVEFEAFVLVGEEPVNLVGRPEGSS